MMQDDGENNPQKLPTWGILMLACTFIAFSGVYVMIEYTFGRILPTLLMIESPQDVITFDPLPTEDSDSTILKDPEQAQVKAQPITASFRRTVKHLQAIGGFRARFRGIAIFIVRAFAVNTLSGFISVLPLLNYIPRPVWNILAIVLCAPLSLAWTHIVISEPSPKTWFRRLPSLKTSKKIMVPVAILAVAEQLSVYVPYSLAIITGLADKSEDLGNMTNGQRTGMAFAGMAIFALGLGLAILVVIPANVVLTRVSASLLADTEETIVPFDRSFGGKVIPEIVGGSGVIGMLDAWKSFDRASRIRLIMAYIKLFVMQVGVSILFSLCLAAQMFLVAGTNWSKFFPQKGDQLL